MHEYLFEKAQDFSRAWMMISTQTCNILFNVRVAEYKTQYSKLISYHLNLKVHLKLSVWQPLSASYHVHWPDNVL